MKLFFSLLAAFLAGSNASPSVLPRQSSVRLAVSPNCGTLAGAPASVNAGLKDLSSFDTIVAFGDSYTSGGVADGSALAPADIVPPNPSAGGRISNGKLWVENLANVAGATLHDYAINGSVIDAMEFQMSSPLRQQKDFLGQVNSYLSSRTRPVNPDTTLFVVFVGTRDYENREDLTFQNFSLTTGAISYAIADLTFSSGVKNFLFVDNYGRGEKTSDGEAYKQALFDALKDAKAQMGISFAFADLYPIWNGVLGSNPGYEAFGFTSPGACIVDQSLNDACDDPDHTFYWISEYPSASTHSIMAEYVEKVITQFRKAGYQAIDRICDYYYELQQSKFPVVSQVEPGYLRPLLPSAAPDAGEDFQQIADDYQKYIVPGYTHWQHPSFFGYFPTGFSFEGLLGDLYSSSVSNPGFNWAASPSCTELESIVLDWAAQMFGLSPAFLNSSGTGGSCIQNTASDSALVAIIAARSTYTAQFPDAKLEDLVIYTTTQTHSLGVKSAMVLGLSTRALEVKREDKFSLRGDTLRTALEEDRKKGKKPFILIATVGTTSSGAVDNLAEIKEVVLDYPELKIHVDAAWAGLSLVCPEYRDKFYLNEINEIADSYSTNFHKMGLVNFDTSPLWVRNRKYLTDALDVNPPFLRTAAGDAGTTIEYRNWHIGLGRRYRSVKLWFVLRGYGVEGFQKYIRKLVSLRERFVEHVSSSDLLQLVAPPSLALAVFRIEPKQPNEALPEESLNNLNRLFYGRISARKEVLLTQTVLDGSFCIRFSVGSPRTQEEHVDKAFEILTHEARLAIESWKQDAAPSLD
ncbi:hypothetical protein D9758_008462 [Tetrapyrgos nigripes]|uniref:Uncharacterized protein n=1 Tax=Tetrapyrgos nigripes TaxID=182062 RepID=A0A8H5CQR1_9AGAR|nr:hypothetical protein D9758_008462 [Tetrapyrgos nigripes]